MDRRDTIKSLILGSLAGGFTLSACDPSETELVETPRIENIKGYGRTQKEKNNDARLMANKFFSKDEINTLSVLCDLILPATENAGSATDAGVPDFLEFIVKDIPEHQVPLRGGLMWLDQRANRRFNTVFTSCSGTQQIDLLDEIAYPDKAKPEVAQGVQFFTRLRNLVLTGYYTTKMGIDDLGYKGNAPNVWDGVPDHVLEKHGLSYDPEWLAKCIDQDKRMEIAKWS